MAKLDQALANDCFTLAKRIAPKDTRNLVLNGMSLRRFGNDYAIYYSGAVVPYLDYLENGTKFFKGHQGFIEEKTFNALTRLIDSVQNNRFHSNRFQTVRNQIDSLKPNLRTDAQYLKSVGGVVDVPR